MPQPNSPGSPASHSSLADRAGATPQVESDLRVITSPGAATDGVIKIRGTHPASAEGQPIHALSAAVTTTIMTNAHTRLRTPIKVFGDGRHIDNGNISVLRASPSARARTPVDDRTRQRPGARAYFRVIQTLSEIISRSSPPR